MYTKHCIRTLLYSVQKGDNIMGYINESVIYNIYPLGFCGAPKENDFKQEYRLDKIYGWIDHMKSMSVNALVFNPVFESSKHGYDTIDYKKIDCRLGDNESFKKFAKHFTITASELCLTAFLIMWEEISLPSKMFNRTVKIQDMRLGLKM